MIYTGLTVGVLGLRRHSHSFWISLSSLLTFWKFTTVFPSHAGDCELKLLLTESYRILLILLLLLLLLLLLILLLLVVVILILLLLLSLLLLLLLLFFFWWNTIVQQNSRAHSLSLGLEWGRSLFDGECLS